MQKLVILHLLLILIIVFLYDSKSLNLFSLGNVAYKKMYIKQMYILKDSNYKNTWFKIKVYLPFDVSLCPSWYLCTHSQTPKCNHFSTFFDNHHLVCLYRFTMLICTLKYMSQIGLFRVQRLFKWLAWAFSQHGNEIQKRNIPKEKNPSVYVFIKPCMPHACRCLIGQSQSQWDTLLHKHMDSRKCDSLGINKAIVCHTGLGR